MTWTDVENVTNQTITSINILLTDVNNFFLNLMYTTPVTSTLTDVISLFAKLKYNFLLHYVVG